MNSYASILISHFRLMWRRILHIFQTLGSSEKRQSDLFPGNLEVKQIILGGDSLVKPAAVDSFDMNDPNPFGWDVRSLVLPSSAGSYLDDDIEAQQAQQSMPRAMLESESKYSPWQSQPSQMTQLGFNLNQQPQHLHPMCLSSSHQHTNNGSSHHQMYASDFSAHTSLYEEEYVGFVEYQMVKEQFEDEMALEDDEDEEVVGGLFDNLIDGFALDDEMVLSKSSQHSEIFSSQESELVHVYMAKKEPPSDGEISPLDNNLYHHIKQEDEDFNLHDFSVISSSVEDVADVFDQPRSSSASESSQYQCPDCASNFKVKSYLTRHMKKHLAAKAFMCPFYSEEGSDDDGKSTILRSGTKCHTTGGFSRRDTFKVHLKALHFIYPPGTKSSMRNSIGGRCAGCFQFFETNAVWMEEHISKNKCPGAVNKN
ncbi:unnamed protein product [Kuraishia capsulata CBS 1993]|uniref:C2H2-type domain-containing protein n=1 Tax=Kuraishia capsulata CBS 1993 TaxID=1382522 RepID=W6MRP7_9ASCO|nr:uncharacterized protein KUCA_T00005382001 [Kuraishia capsulata CBS 1993]CDK29394.1 unnamed protein product [Kuraishia capsulata CBS 1993]